MALGNEKRRGLIRMHLKKRGFILGLIVFVAQTAAAGASGSVVTPGSREIEGKITEWAVPSPRFARDPAPGPDGNIYFAIMAGNKIGRFDVMQQTFTEWGLLPGTKPHGLVVDLRLAPTTGKVIENKLPSGGDPHSLVLDAFGFIWFTIQNGSRIGRLDTRTGEITEYKTSGRPDGIALDQEGNVWFCQIDTGSLGKLDPATGSITEITLDPEARPLRIAASPDGSLWVTLFGKGSLIRVDPVAETLIKEYPLPAGPSGGPYAVTVDGGGMVWTNEFYTNTVVRLDPRTGQTRVFTLPSKGLGIRKMTVDAEGRVWYMGSHNGRLGVIE
jgi:virginiamycin B lyase